MDRPSLLKPGPTTIKVERYMLGIAQLPAVEGETVSRFETRPDITFRPEKLVYSAGLPMTKLQGFLLKRFSWIAFPWFRIEIYEPIDEIPDDKLDAMSPEDFAKIEDTAKRVRFYWYRPVFEWVQWSMQRAQEKALRGVVVKSIAVDGTELLIDAVPLQMFSALAVGMRFDAPTCRSGRPIRVVTSKVTVPLMLSMVGAAPSV